MYKYSLLNVSLVNEFLDSYNNNYIVVIILYFIYNLST